MTSTSIPQPDGTTLLNVDLYDEGVVAEGQTRVIGDVAAATRYASVFADDLRRLHADQYPQPQPVEEPI